MARYTGADCRVCRRSGCKLFLKGDRCTNGKCAFDKRPQVPGVHGLARKKITEYGAQLSEKQKVKKYYGLLEKQFYGYYEEAARRKGITGLTMLELLEMRLDNVVYRMGITASRTQARQIVNHGHILVNKKAVNIPSYITKKGDVITVKESKVSNKFFTELKGAKITTPKWVEFNAEKLVGKILEKPAKEDIDIEIKENLIVELYSK